MWLWNTNAPCSDKVQNNLDQLTSRGIEIIYTFMSTSVPSSNSMTCCWAPTPLAARALLYAEPTPTQVWKAKMSLTSLLSNVPLLMVHRQWDLNLIDQESYMLHCTSYTIAGLYLMGLDFKIDLPYIYNGS